MIYQALTLVVQSPNLGYIFTLALNVVLFFLSPKLVYMKNKQYKHDFGSQFHLERKKNVQHSPLIQNFAYSLNEQIYLLASKYISIPLFCCILKETFLDKQCLFSTYLMTNQSLFSTLRHNIFLIKYQLMPFYIQYRQIRNILPKHTCLSINNDLVQGIQFHFPPQSKQLFTSLSLALMLLYTVANSSIVTIINALHRLFALFMYMSHTDPLIQTNIWSLRRHSSMQCQGTFIQTIYFAFLPVAKLCRCH